MNPLIASIGFIGIVIGLFWLDRDPKTRPSWAVCIPILWLTINGTRPISMWLNMGPNMDTPDAALDGSPVDAVGFGIILIVAFVVASGRGPQIRAFMRNNWPMVAFFAYCAVSVLWSDFPFVAFKRWVKAVGEMVMIMLLVTDPFRDAAIKRMFAWIGFLVIPLSILTIKYYPEIGRGYGRWDGKLYNIGLTTNKNQLGMMCLVVGLASLWRFLTAYRSKNNPLRKRQMMVHGILTLMVLWLLQIANSATSISCFGLAGGILIVTSMFRFARRRAMVHLITVLAISAACSALFFSFGSGALETLGRDSTLTGRTEIWHLVLGMVKNPILGTGFESFWLGDRLEQVWNIYWFHLNEAHSGYIELFLNLGWVGIILLAVLVLHGYREIVNLFHRDFESAQIRLAYLVAALVYSTTEAGFRMMSPVWFVCLLATASAPRLRVPAAIRQRMSKFKPAQAASSVPVVVEHPPQFVRPLSKGTSTF